MSTGVLPPTVPLCPARVFPAMNCLHFLRQTSLHNLYVTHVQRSCAQNIYDSQFCSKMQYTVFRYRFVWMHCLWRVNRVNAGKLVVHEATHLPAEMLEICLRSKSTITITVPDFVNQRIRVDSKSFFLLLCVLYYQLFAIFVAMFILVSIWLSYISCWNVKGHWYTNTTLVFQIKACILRENGGKWTRKC